MFVIKWLWHRDCNIVVVTLWLRHCVTLLLWHDYRHCDVLSYALLIYLTLLWFWNCICRDNGVVTSELEHYRGNTYTVLHAFSVQIYFYFFMSHNLNRIFILIYTGCNQDAEASHLDGSNCYCHIWDLLGVWHNCAQYRLLLASQH